MKVALRLIAYCGIVVGFAVVGFEIATAFGGISKVSAASICAILAAAVARQSRWTCPV